MSIYFITSNKNKFEEAKLILGEIEQLDIHLPEIQDIDPMVIVKEKVIEACKHRDGGFFIDDTFLSMNCLGGLPGPYIKGFMKAVGVEGLAMIAEKLNDFRATAKVIVAYAKNQNDFYFFEGTAKGSLVTPRGKGGFGWDPIFQPDGSKQTFAEMKEREPGPNAVRRIALEKFKKFLVQNKLI